MGKKKREVMPGIRGGVVNNASPDLQLVHSSLWDCCSQHNLEKTSADFGLGEQRGGLESHFPCSPQLSQA